MIKLISKTFFLTLIVCCTAVIARAQLGYDYSQYEIGAAVGFNSVSGATETPKITPTFHLNLTYDPTPYVNVVFEAQMGQIAGGDTASSTGRSFTGDLTSFVLRAQLQMGEIIDYSHNQFKNVLKNFYLSTGVGYAISHITSINRYDLKPPYTYTGGETNSQEPFIPIRIGYEFKVFNKYQQPAFKVDLGYEYNLVLGDSLDGFSDANKRDSYSQFVIGVKFAFGGDIISYRKQIPY